MITTSCNPECGRAYGRDHWEKLDVLDHSLATDLLMSAAGYDTCSTERESGGKIVEKLGCHTLAVMLAGPYVAKGHCGLSQYLDVYEESWHRTLKHHPKREQSRYGSIHATFEASGRVWSVKMVRRVMHSSYCEFFRH